MRHTFCKFFSCSFSPLLDSSKGTSSREHTNVDNVSSFHVCFIVDLYIELPVISMKCSFLVGNLGLDIVPLVEHFVQSKTFESEKVEDTLGKICVRFGQVRIHRPVNPMFYPCLHYIGRARCV